MSDPASVTDALRAIADPLPPGSGVMLPVEWLRAVADMQERAPNKPACGDVDLTVREVAELLDRKASTVRGWCASGKLEAYRLNSREWRIPREALRALQERQRSAMKAANPAASVDLGAWRRRKNM
ncbi:MAG: hypothetical protein JWL61_2204 [Gemmatimonadetes bacterium]|nr:hypothetical protein [Gemmatimonadota bacterium]